jgi:type III secretory pathway component EscU
MVEQQKEELVWEKDANRLHYCFCQVNKNLKVEIWKFDNIFFLLYKLHDWYIQDHKSYRSVTVAKNSVKKMLKEGLFSQLFKNN